MFLLYSTTSVTRGRQFATACDSVSSVWRRSARLASKVGVAVVGRRQGLDQALRPGTRRRTQSDRQRDALPLRRRASNRAGYALDYSHLWTDPSTGGTGIGSPRCMAKRPDESSEGEARRRARSPGGAACRRRTAAARDDDAALLHEEMGDAQRAARVRRSPSPAGRLRPTGRRWPSALRRTAPSIRMTS